jgi:histone-lysine N-methyltransferase SETMAR
MRSDEKNRASVARLHAAQTVADLFDRWGWEVLYHPPYTPDLSPCDFNFIPKMKEPLHDIRFRTNREVLQAVDRSIRTIKTPGPTKDILRLPRRWQWVVHNAGDYIEGQQNFETCIYFVSVVNK